MKISRVITLAVLAAFAGVLATGAPQAQTKEPIKVGLIQPLSGPIAAAGSYITNGAKIAVERINAKGGVLGRPLELIIEDNKSDPAETRNAAEKLIVRDKVPVIIGAWGSSMTLAMMPLAAQAQDTTDTKTLDTGSTRLYRQFVKIDQLVPVNHYRGDTVGRMVCDRKVKLVGRVHVDAVRL